MGNGEGSMPDNLRRGINALHAGSLGHGLSIIMHSVGFDTCDTVPKSLSAEVLSWHHQQRMTEAPVKPALCLGYDMSAKIGDIQFLRKGAGG